jgi:DNA-directed RNA polymerase subunit beta'
VVVNRDDCGTINGIAQSAIKTGEDIVQSLKDRIVGRYTLERVKHPITGEIIVDVNEEVTEAIADAIDEAGIETVRIRTVLTCEAEHGVCRMCYGRNLATNRTVDIGEAVGTIAAQSIGQPGTQLTMRTFHTGGVAFNISEENRIFLKYPVYIRDVTGAHVDKIDEKTGEPTGVWLFTRKGQAIVNRIMETYRLEPKDDLLVENGHRVVRGAPLIKRGKEEIRSPGIAYAMVVREGPDLRSADRRSPHPVTLYLIGQDQRIEIRNGSEFLAKKGDVVDAEKTIATFDTFSDPIIAETGGTVRYEDIIPGTTLKEEFDD